MQQGMNIIVNSILIEKVCPRYDHQQNVHSSLKTNDR